MNKPFTYVVVTNPDEIASIQADGFEDIIGGQLEDGTWIAEKESLLRWREHKTTEKMLNAKVTARSMCNDAQQY